MNCYFTCQKLSKFSKACFTTTKETALAPFNLAHLAERLMNNTRQIRLKHREKFQIDSDVTSMD